jgi:sugar O-acyltransferase (sialic acid O-acetyltransferase NeuD family)
VKPVAVLGAGGHAKVIVATLRAMGREVVGCYVRDANATMIPVLGVPILDERALPTADVELVLAIGDNALRARLAQKLGAAGVLWATAVHPRAIVEPGVVVEPGAMICAGAVLQVDVRVGAHAIVNTSAHVDHDGVVGAFAHVGPGAHVAGDVTIEEGAFVATGASIIPGRRVGAWSVVGAGGVVVTDVPARATVVGVPARSRVDMKRS